MDRGERGNKIVIAKNLDTQQEYKTDDDTMQRFWSYLFPGVAYFSNSSSGKTEYIEIFDLDASKAGDFELGLTRNPPQGGSRRRYHRRRALRKHNKSNRTFRKKSRATRRR
jgi:hypothetical protein